MKRQAYDEPKARSTFIKIYVVKKKKKNAWYKNTDMLNPTIILVGPFHKHKWALSKNEQH